MELDPWHTEWKDCPFRDRVSSSIDIDRFVHLSHGQLIVTFRKPGSGRYVEVFYETIGDNPDDAVLEKIQAYCLDGVPFDGMREP